MRRTGLALLALLVTTPLAHADPLLAERPADATCDRNPYFLCGGADAGAKVDCATDRAGLATCTYTFGYLSGAWSTLQLPGRVTTTYGGSIRTCVDQACDDAPIVTPTNECTWLTTLQCDSISVTSGPVTVTRALALGQCLRIGIALQVAIEADAPLGQAMYHVAYANQDGGAGETCFVTDGR